MEELDYGEWRPIAVNRLSLVLLMCLCMFVCACNNLSSIGSVVQRGHILEYVIHLNPDFAAVEQVGKMDGLVCLERLCSGARCLPGISLEEDKYKGLLRADNLAIFRRLEGSKERFLLVYFEPRSYSEEALAALDVYREDANMYVEYPYECMTLDGDKITEYEVGAVGDVEILHYLRIKELDDLRSRSD